METITHVVLSLLCLSVIVKSDIYLHNPRGSNNRLDETTRARTNRNRIFNSENNDRGGYNVGSLFYYQGSMLPIEWTNQHSCASVNSNCEVVLQYMCADTVRDGATTKTIPANKDQCLNKDCNHDYTYGMHEDYDYYMSCVNRRRNAGLFIADRKLAGRNRQSAIYTRQNNKGTRYGYECTEEKDYYPYWHPTPWRDIAVLTNNPRRCEYYQNESENVKPRWACVLETNVDNNLLPNNKEECEKYASKGTKAKWTKFPSHELPAPICRETQFTRDNHLGNSIGGHPIVFNWTVPNIIHENCVIRIRYNISTNDYDGWKTNSLHNGNPTKVKMADKYGFPSEDVAAARGYKFKNDPEVKLFDDADFTLQLAMNTAQYGRVFQDRSHTFGVRPVPEGLDSTKTIHNLNVRGKRGNIVQVYPSVEYDFVPNTLEMGTDDYIHFQWTGSNTNNRNNAGNGLAGTDRNNVVLLAMKNYPEGSGNPFGPGPVFGHYGNNYPQHVDNNTMLGFGLEDVEKLAYLSQYGGEMSQLDDAGTYFNLDPRAVNQVGTYHYMCTRNNDFTNRDQKGRVIVYPHPVHYAAIGWTGGSFSLQSGMAKIDVGQGVFAELRTLRLEEWSVLEGEKQLTKKHRTMNIGDRYSSNFLIIHPQDKLTVDDKTFTVEMKTTESGNNIAIYRSNSDNFATWTKVNAVISGGTARFQSREGGVFVARSSNNLGMIVGIAVAAIVVVLVAFGGVLYFRCHPKKWEAVKSNVYKVKRSTQSKI